MDDRPLGTPYKGRIQYLLHVRKSWPHFCTTNCAKVGLAGAKRCRKTDSRLTPNNLSSPYLCVLLSRHSCLIVNNIRDCAVTHNPKVAGSNPAPATICGANLLPSKSHSPSAVNVLSCWGIMLIRSTCSASFARSEEHT